MSFPVIRSSSCPGKFLLRVNRLHAVIIYFRAQAELQIDMVKHNVQIAKGSLNVSIAKMAKTKNNKRRMTVAKAF